MTFQTFSSRPDITLAYHRFAGTPDKPGVLWLGGFRSDMTGIKATFLEEQCRKRSQSYVRFDYTGHGSSSGKFDDGNIGSWLQDALDALDHLTAGPQILVGSSMGGWIALLLALKRPERIKGLVGIAPAPDFSEDVWLHEFNDQQRQEVLEKGVFRRPSAYDDAGYPLYRHLFEDGRRHLLLHQPINIACPVHIVQGKKDDAVHWTKAEKIKGKLISKNVVITYIDDGDHRLSRPEDLNVIDEKVIELSRASGK